MDDSILGSSQEDAEQMHGQRVDGEYTGTVPKILAYGVMQVKFMAITGSSDVWEAEQLAGKTLGVMYCLQSDEIVFIIKPGYYAAKAKSSDQSRELVVLDEGAGLCNRARGKDLHEETSSQHGNGHLRPAGPGQPSTAAWQAPALPLIRTYHVRRLGRRPSSSREDLVGRSGSTNYSSQLRQRFPALPSQATRWDSQGW